MYNNPYTYNTQLERDRIDSQIARLQDMKNQLTQPMANQQPSINQTFQLAPNGGNSIRYVNSLDEVKKEIVYNDTPFFSNDLSVLWIKNNKGDVRAFELKEIVKKDEKDIIIDSLQLQINELKEEIKNAKSNYTNDDEPNQNEQSSDVSNRRTSKKK